MKKLLHLIVLCLSISIFTGCATMKHNYILTSKNFDFPNTNTQTTVYIGEAMIIQDELITAEFLQVNATYGGFCYIIPPGEYLKKGTDGKNIYFDTYSNFGQVERHRLCDTFSGMYISLNNPNKICVITVLGAYECYDATYSIIKKNIPIQGNIQKTLFFSGKKDDAVLLMYIEKRGIRTIHTHDTSYNIKTPSIVSYRGARIKIIEYTNESITYEMLNNFPDVQ